MKPAEAYRILIADGTIHIKEPIAFKIVTSTSEKLVNPFTFGHRNQHFNCEVLIFQATQKINIQFVCSLDLKPAEVDLTKSKQVINIIDKSGKNQGAITLQVQNIKNYPSQKNTHFIRSIKAEFTLGMAPKKQIFLILKLGQKHIQTQIAQIDQITSIWQQEHQLQPQDTYLNLYVQCWQNQDQYVGTSVVPIQQSLNKPSKHALKDLKQIQIGVIQLKLLDQQNYKIDIQSGNDITMRPLKIYVIQAILNPQFNSKTHTFVNIKLGDNKNKLATTSVFSDQRKPKWNQSFQIVIRNEQYITFEICQRSQQQQKVLAVSQIKTDQLNDGKLALDLQSNNNDIGKLYIQVQAKQQNKFKSPPSKISPVLKSQSPINHKKQQSKSNKLKSKLGNPQTLKRLKQMKQKYSGKSLYDYYNEQLNEALRQGLLVIAKQKPTDPVKQLGLFLINYKK